MKVVTDVSNYENSISMALVGVLISLSVQHLSFVDVEKRVLLSSVESSKNVNYVIQFQEILLTLSFHYVQYKS